MGSSGKPLDGDDEGDSQGLCSQEAMFQQESRQRINKQAKEVNISDPPTVGPQGISPSPSSPSETTGMVATNSV